MLFLVKDKQIVPYLAGLMALVSIINCIFFYQKNGQAKQASQATLRQGI